MKIYLVVSSKGHLKILADKNYPHLLISQLNRSIVREGIKNKGTDLLVDSGAYTAWSKGKNVDIDDYIKFCVEINKQKGDKTIFINLDVIPGRFGFVPSKEEIEKSSIEGWKNYQKMKSAGLKVMHIFHQHENPKWLHKLMKEDEDYIGISPANDLSGKARLKWLRAVFGVVKGKKKTHGFGVTNVRILREIPFYSADSSNWSGLTRWGSVPIYNELNTKSIKYKKLKDSLTMNISYKALDNRKVLQEELGKTVDNIMLMENDLTRLWEKRGIKFD